MTEGKFKKRFQDIANRIPMGILNELHMRERHPIYIPDTFNKIVEEANQEFPLASDEKYQLSGEETRRGHTWNDALYRFDVELFRKKWFPTVEEKKTKTCPNCGGRGWIRQLGFMLGIRWLLPLVVCSTCKGEGVIDE